MFGQRWLTAVGLVLGVGVLVAACGGRVDSASPDTQLDRSDLDNGPGGGDVVQVAPLVEPSDAVPSLMSSMTLEQKVGQLLMPTFNGLSDQVSVEEAEANLAAYGAATPSEIVRVNSLGGLIYLPENIESAPQLRSLSQTVQATAVSTTGVPLLVAVDQEGGRVARLTDEVSNVPAASALAGRIEEIRRSSFATGQQVREQGVNVVLAPVADVVLPDSTSFISDRSYGSDPATVAEAVGAAVHGLQQSGVAAAVKHWPGHGATSVDSHETLPTLDVDRVTWESRELVPFLAAFDREVAIVLVGHLALPQFDPSADPATLSFTLIEDLLRGQYGFEGVVMTDALNMGAVESYSSGELAVAAVEAGADVVLMPPNLVEARAALLGAVQSGRLSEERLDQSVSRILYLKQSLGLLSGPVVQEDDQ